MEPDLGIDRLFGIRNTGSERFRKLGNFCGWGSTSVLENVQIEAGFGRETD